MADQPFKSPVGDSVPRVDDQIAVGEDLEFQRKWWRFERIVWSIFLVILICDLLGLFGRGWLAKATRSTADGALKLNYERIERADTPSIMTLHFNDAAIQDGKIHLFVSESVTRPLGAQRIAPEPMVSALGDAGNTYTFAATHGPATVQIALEPSFPGEHHFHIELLGEPSGGESIDGSVFVVP